MKNYVVIGIIALLVVVTIVLQSSLESVKKERDKYEGNNTVLLSEIERYTILDSLNVAQVGVLKMSINELKRYRNDDASLIKKLQGKAKDLAQLTSIQASTIANFKGVVKDSVIVVDSVLVKLKCIDVHNSWYNIKGCIIGDSIEGIMTNRESLKVIERIRYKRFLGFLWKTKKIKDRKIDVFSLNPHTHIDSVESIIIED